MMIPRLLFLISFSVVFQLNAQEHKLNVDTAEALQHVKILSADEYEGRLTGTSGNAKARAYIIDAFSSYGLKPLLDRYEQEFSFSEHDKLYKASNIIAYAKGSTKPDDYIVVSAHYDHVGKKGDEVYNGADDNASGIGALLSMAKYFSDNPPLHSIIFVAFDAEELGLEGAKYFVEDTKDLNIVLNINMDMIGRSSKNELYVVGSRYYPELSTIINDFQNPTKTKLLVGHDGSDNKQDWTYSSDHGPFHKEGIPFLYFGNEDHEDYHGLGDEFEKLTVDFYKDAVEMILGITKLADNSL